VSPSQFKGTYFFRRPVVDKEKNEASNQFSLPGVCPLVKWQEGHQQFSSRKAGSPEKLDHLENGHGAG